MNPMSFLAEVVSDIEAIGTVSSSLSGKVKSARSELESIEREAGPYLEKIVSGARNAVSSLKSEAERVQAPAASEPTKATSVNDIVTAAVPTASAAEISDAIEAFDKARAAGEDPHAAAQAAALQAGASESDAIAIAEAITIPQ